MIFKIETSFITDKTMRTRRLTTPKNLENLRKHLWNRDLYRFCPTDSADNITNYIVTELTSAYDSEVPIIEVKPPPPCGYFHKETKKHMKQSNRIRYAMINKEWNDKQYTSIKAKLKKLNKFCKGMQRRDKIHNEIRSFETSAKKGIFFFYSHVKNINGKSTKTGPVFDSNGVLRSSKEDMANSFGEHLGNQLRPDLTLEETHKLQLRCLHFENLPFCQPQMEKLFPDWATPHPNGPSQTLDQIYVSPGAVKEQIKKAKRNAAPGPDGLPMIVYAVAADIIAPMLAMLYNLIGQTGEIPALFRETRVRMLYKKKDKNNMSNYRPLSMSNHIGKTWERCVNTAIMEHLETNNLLSNRQHSFRPKRGTFSNLTRLWESVVSKVEEERALVELWNFDLTKAFDLLDHSKVLHLCHQAGIGGYLGFCIQNSRPGSSMLKLAQRGPRKRKWEGAASRVRSSDQPCG